MPSPAAPSPSSIPLFRAFVIDAAGKPRRGARFGMLGVRVPKDIKVDGASRVHPDQGGMSVTPDHPSRMPFHLRPKALGGDCVLPLFSIQSSRLGEQLRYTPDAEQPNDHGFIEPAQVMALDSYQSALAATVDEWQPWTQEVV